MIEKDRDYPIRLLMYESLMERIQKNHPKTALINQDYKAWRAGYKGELQTRLSLEFFTREGIPSIQGFTTFR